MPHRHYSPVHEEEGADRGGGRRAPTTMESKTSSDSDSHKISIGQVW